MYKETPESAKGDYLEINTMQFISIATMSQPPRCDLAAPDCRLHTEVVQMLIVAQTRLFLGDRRLKHCMTAASSRDRVRQNENIRITKLTYGQSLFDHSSSVVSFSYIVEICTQCICALLKERAFGGSERDALRLLKCYTESVLPSNYEDIIHVKQEIQSATMICRDTCAYPSVFHFATQLV